MCLYYMYEKSKNYKTCWIYYLQMLATFIKTLKTDTGNFSIAERAALAET